MFLSQESWDSTLKVGASAPSNDTTEKVVTAKSDLTMVTMKLLLILLASVFPSAQGLRFGPSPVSVDSVVLIVNRPATLTCHYVKYRTESIREIDWFVAYSGFRTKIFHLSVTSGTKEKSVYPFIQTDDVSADHEHLTVTLTEFRDSNMTFGCEVTSVRDNGYGKLRHYKKLGESIVSVVNSRDHELLIKKRDGEQNSHLSVAAPGEDVTVACVSRGAIPSPKLSLVVQGRNFTEILGGRVDAAHIEGKQATLIGKLTDVAEELFKDGYLTIECLAHYDDFLFDKKELSLAREEPDVVRHNGNPYGYNPAAHGYDANRRDDAYYSNRYNSGLRQGREGYSYDDDDDQYDPSRRVHQPQEQDFFAGYVLLKADSVDSNFATLIGELPYDVETALNRNYGRINQLRAEETRVKLSTVKVLNLMGNMGYKVVAASDRAEQGYAWTMERRMTTNPNDAIDEF